METEWRRRNAAPIVFGERSIGLRADGLKAIPFKTAKLSTAADVTYTMRRFRVVLLLILAATSVAWGQEPSVSPSNSDNPVEASPSQSPAFELKPDSNGVIPQAQMQELFRIVADKDLENDKRQRDYTYTVRSVEKQLDGKGQVKKTEIKTFEVMDIDGEQINRLIEKDDKPLSEKDAAKESERVQKIIDKRKNESEGDRRKREEKEEKQREDGRKFVKEVADAYTFKLLGTETVGGREAWVIEAEPRPNFVPKMKESKFLSKFHGRMWVDERDLQLSKLDAEAIDTVSVGWVLARIHKGAHFMLEQTRVNDEVWLPRQLSFNIDARIALLKGFRVEGEQSFRDYRKFRTSSKILGYAEVTKP
jgi:hypothetical protein